MKKIIFRKISLDCFKFFLLSVISIGVIIWVLQAVNYLDFVVEDGHGLPVYLKYTLLSFPKIISRVFPFMVFFSIIYILLKYENKNELVIFWSFGVSKMKFINLFIKLSFVFVILNLLLNSVIAPTAQNKARSFIRSSNLDFFESMLRPKKFIDIIKDLTIYFDEKTPEGTLKKIFLKDNSKEDGFQVTYAKIGKFEFRGNRKVLVLYQGKTLNSKNGKFSEFAFSKTDFNMSDFGTNAVSVAKTQENSTSQILNCLWIFQKKKIQLKKDADGSYIFTNCRLDNLSNIYKEFYRRLIIPFYNTFLVMISLLLILKSKDSNNFSYYKSKIFIFGFITIVFTEASFKFIGINIIKNSLIFSLPAFFCMAIYYYFSRELTIKKHENLH